MRFQATAIFLLGFGLAAAGTAKADEIPPFCAKVVDKILADYGMGTHVNPSPCAKHSDWDGGQAYFNRYEMAGTAVDFARREKPSDTVAPYEVHVLTPSPIKGMSDGLSATIQLDSKCQVYAIRYQRTDGDFGEKDYQVGTKLCNRMAPIAAEYRQGDAELRQAKTSSERETAGHNWKLILEKGKKQFGDGTTKIFLYKMSLCEQLKTLTDARNAGPQSSESSSAAGSAGQSRTAQ